MSERPGPQTQPTGSAVAAAATSPAVPLGPQGELHLKLEPDYCCGGGHCGPLPGYLFTCPSCGRPSGSRTGDHLRPGEYLTCYLCKRRLRMVREISLFELVFVYEDAAVGAPASPGQD